MRTSRLLLLAVTAASLASCATTESPSDSEQNPISGTDGAPGQDGLVGDGTSSDGWSDGTAGDGSGDGALDGTPDDGTSDGTTGDGTTGDGTTGDGTTGDGTTGDGTTGDGTTGDGTTGDGSLDGGDDASGDDASGDGDDGVVGTPYACNRGAPVITSLEPSTSPPGGLAVENVPQFISIGFDDNRYADGMAWALSVFDGLNNPSGSGEGCTFDGSVARVSFFVTSRTDVDDDALKNLHVEAYEAGHEVGNHTNSHGEILQKNADPNVWNSELGTCNSYLRDIGVPAAAIVGFRTPFLAWSEATFQQEIEHDFLYDCSIEHFFGASGFQWPYTLDHQSTQTYVKPTGSYPGLWELPVSELMMATTGWNAVTGFDYNMWVTKHMSKEQFLDVMKANLELRMQGGNGAPANRAPLFLGAHTDYYSEQNPSFQSAVGGSSTVAERRAAIEEFVEYALSYHPDVRIVPHAEIVRWMQSPVGLDGTKGR